SADVTRLVRELRSEDARTRAGAAEALGFLRAAEAADGLTKALEDADTNVRRNSALSLAWCGRRDHVPALLTALTDRDWSVRQSAAVALANLLGKDLPFDGLADENTRTSQAAAWRERWLDLSSENGLTECVEALAGASPGNLAMNCPVSASSTYKGPVSALTDPDDGHFWQTKNVPFPQHVTVDLGRIRDVGCVYVEQYVKRFCMTDYDVSVSSDGAAFESVLRERKTSPLALTVVFPSRATRYVRVTSHAALTPTYPTTFRTIEIYASAPRESALETRIRAARILGVLGVGDAADVLANGLEPYRSRTLPEGRGREFVQIGLRALGRIGGPIARETLCRFLQRPQFARYAADALGELGDVAAIPPLLAAYPACARPLSRKPPKLIPADDIPRFESVDRMYETPFAIAAALSRLVQPTERDINQMAEIAPLLLANLPGDFDGMMLYEPEAGHRVTSHLLDVCGHRKAAISAALETFGANVGAHGLVDANTFKTYRGLAAAAPGDAPYGATWLCALISPGEFVPQLRQLLKHTNGWVRINAAKALMFSRAHDARTDLAALLANSKPEAKYGYNGRFFFRTRQHRGQDEYNAPSPRWREAFARALGVLGTPDDVPLLRQLLTHDGNVLEVQTAAAEGLAAIGGTQAVTALREAAGDHAFHSIRLLARERLKAHGLGWPQPRPHTPTPIAPAEEPPSSPVNRYVFIRGPNQMPNDFSIDIWRQTYSTTDSGPTYRLGRSLWSLATDSTLPETRLLLDAQDGWIADCEVSWDGQHIVFARRGGDDAPWWHLFEIRADGSGLKQLTEGPYHDVQPAYLPDGRIVFSTSRIGMRDEYHGYPATGLAVMQADGSHIRCIGFNTGRDDEPALMNDGRIVFGRLELFYSRLKTERTLHAVFPDGSGDVTLYGPERRAFWQGITRASGEKWWQESGIRHRVLRLTQPQAMPDGRALCVTTGGLTVVGPGRSREHIIPRWRNMAVTSPFPLPDGRILCAATTRVFSRKDVDLGLYLCDPITGELTLLHNDPTSAEFEARPIIARASPPVLASRLHPSQSTATVLCDSVFRSRHPAVRERGKLLRIVEGIPPVARHHTHTNRTREAWKNHTGTLGRVLGTVPLAADGSFNVTVPADRLFHCQVLDSDRRVLGNQLIWMYSRPGEARSCVGCHEPGDTTPSPVRAGFSQSSSTAPLPCLPSGGEFLYRAKLWQKGTLSDEGEERTRTVRAVNLLGRY
ncbi:MAG: hypothetical protein HON70_28720, partial [Lentisphaerae bacterium]|nr:hypothetical protein [Lentisphaerota bacterium]